MKRCLQMAFIPSHTSFYVTFNWANIYIYTSFFQLRLTKRPRKRWIIFICLCFFVYWFDAFVYNFLAIEVWNSFLKCEKCSLVTHGCEQARIWHAYMSFSAWLYYHEDVCFISSVSENGRTVLKDLLKTCFWFLLQARLNIRSLWCVLTLSKYVKIVWTIKW